MGKGRLPSLIVDIFFTHSSYSAILLPRFHISTTHMHHEARPLFAVVSARKLFFILGIGMVIAGFLFAQNARAQEGDTPAPAAPVFEPPAPQPEPATAEPVFLPDEPVAGPQVGPSPVVAPPAPLPVAFDDVLRDETVTHEDLGVSDSAILPDSALYGFKRFGRGLRELFTFGAADKADVELRHANQELFDAKKLVDQKAGDANAVARAGDAIERFEEKLGGIAERADALRDRRAGGDGRVDALLDSMLDGQIKQQKLLDSIGQKAFDDAPPEAAQDLLDTVANVKDMAAGHATDVLFRVDAGEENLAERFDRVLERQEGSEFKDLRNLEVLKQLEGKLPEEARGAIERAQENALKRFGDEFGQLPESERGERFEQYAEGMGGDPASQMEIFDRMEGLAGAPPELLQKIETAKDIAARRFSDDIGKFDGKEFEAGFAARAKERAFARMKDFGPDPAKLRVLDEMRQRVTPDQAGIQEEIQKTQQGAVRRFKDQFNDLSSQDQAARFEALSKKMAENPDPTTFRLIQQLEEEVKADPGKRAFIEQMEQATKQKFVERASKEKDRFLEQFASTNPQDIAIIQQLQQDFQADPNSFFGPQPFAGGEGFLPPGVGPEGFGPPPFGEGGFEGFPGQGEFPGFDQQFAPPGFENFFDQAINKQVERLGENVEGLNDAASFGQFQKKLQFAPPSVIQEIQKRQAGFGQLFRERAEAIAQGDDVRAGNEAERARVDEDFRRRIESAQSEEETAQINGERMQLEQQFLERDLDTRRAFFEEQLQFDPFCDETCKSEEGQRFGERLEQQKQQFFEMRQPGGFGPPPPPVGGFGEAGPPSGGFQQGGTMPAGGQMTPEMRQQFQQQSGGGSLPAQRLPQPSAGGTQSSFEGQPQTFGTQPQGFQDGGMMPKPPPFDGSQGGQFQSPPPTRQFEGQPSGGFQPQPTFDQPSGGFQPPPTFESAPAQPSQPPPSSFSPPPSDFSAPPPPSGGALQSAFFDFFSRTAPQNNFFDYVILTPRDLFESVAAATQLLILGK